MNARHRVLACIVAVCAALPAAAADQAPSDPWRTVETRSFRLHYPAPWEAWARHVAARVEPVRDVVAEAVGYRPERKVDVVLLDPFASANASAIPLLATPRMVLLATPPGADSPIGDATDWTELLVLHEDVHLVHLLRPSRSPAVRWLSRMVGFGPLTLASPRWVSEGYATVLEGRLTGSGRPNGDFRAAVLRARARAGALPTYDALGAVGEGWQDGSMAYLAGSAFLEWLEEGAGRPALPDLWRRMSARQGRPFADAFEGVFGEPPWIAYGRFSAEATWRAVEVERAFADRAVEGETVLERDGATGAPAVSPDGERFAVVVRAPGEDPAMEIWSLAPDEDAEAERREAIDAMLARDPDDVAPVEPEVRPRRAIARLPTVNGAAAESPRFLPDGRTVLFHRLVTDADGTLRADLFAWDVENGALRRVTRGADVREADPGPDGAWAVAVRYRGGASSLVRVDLADGRVETLDEAPIPEVHDGPRVSPDGRSVAYLRHRDGRWRVVVRDLADAGEREVGLPDGWSVSRIAWTSDGARLVAAVGRGGFLDLAVLDPARPDAPPALVTRSVNGVLAPDVVPGGDEAIALGVHADGLDVRRVTLAPVSGPDPEIAGALAPMVRPGPPEAAPRADPTLVDDAPFVSKPYGAGRAEWRAIGNWNLAPSANQFVVGARAGDVLGRWESLALAAFGDRESVRGAAVSGEWRGWPVTVGARVYATEERPSRQGLADPALGTALDLDRAGVELDAGGRRTLTPALRAGAGIGAAVARIEDAAGARVDRRVAFARAGAAWTPSRGRAWLAAGGGAHADFGRTDDDGWTLVGVDADLAAGFGSIGLALSSSWKEVDGATRASDLVSLGGTDGGILPSTEIAARAIVPALPVGTRVGERYLGTRAAIRTGRSGSTSWYWETHRVEGGGVVDDGSVELVGAETRFVLDARPLLRLPRSTIRIGVAHVLRDPLDRLEGRTRAWITWSWAP